MIVCRITGNPLAEEESCIHLLKRLVQVLKTSDQQSTTVEFHVQSPCSREATVYRFRMTYQPKGKQR